MSKEAEQLIARRRKALGPFYTHFYEKPLYLVRGDGVWLYDESVSSRTVDNFIMRLRQKIEEDASNPVRIITVRGGGYSFEG